MWVAPMNNNVVEQRGSEDPNHLFSERLNTEVVNRAQGSGSTAEDDARFNKVTEDRNSGVRGLIQVHESLHISPQPPLGSLVHWERFLPLKSIKVLLVEDDDSTRHVVGALLQNCSYEVTAVSDGLQAWQILEDPSSHIDLILTEVVMPFLSGMGLLCKIMSHKTHKNIPVIMMSSHDSVNIVFKCLSKGAVDFFVKPIRRNELKNLWQHVWRRFKCNNSSDSGSESGTHTRKFAKSRSNDVSENGSDNSNENDFANQSLNIRDGSDDGSGTQSSWTKFPAEVGSPHPIFPHKLLVPATDSTCAQVIHTKPEKVSSRSVHATEKECHEQSDQLDDVAAIGKDLHGRHQFGEFSTHPMGKRIYKMSDADGKQLNRGHGIVCEKGQLVYNSDKTRTKEAQNMNVVDAITDCSNPRAESREFNTPNGLSGISQTKASCCSRPHPTLELTLKRLGGVGDDKNAAGDDHNVLRHSDLSAFSRYNTVSSANQVQTGNAGSCSPLANSSVGLNTETASDFPCHSHGTPPNQQSNGSNNINDMGSTNIYLSTKLDAYDKKPESLTGIESFDSSALHTVHNSSISSPQQIISGQGENAEMLKAQVGGSEQGFQMKCNHWSAESNAGNCNVERSAVESDHGSNGQNGSSSILTTRVINVESSKGAAGSIGIVDIDRKNSGNGADEGRISLREAALTKFRQKRKERCFEKRVRYHSRKKLAEQRPRIRGQFVRSTESDKKEEQDIRNNNLVSMDNSSDLPPNTSEGADADL